MSIMGDENNVFTTGDTDCGLEMTPAFELEKSSFLPFDRQSGIVWLVEES